MSTIGEEVAAFVGGIIVGVLVSEKRRVGRGVSFGFGLGVEDVTAGLGAAIGADVGADEVGADVFGADVLAASSVEKPLSSVGLPEYFAHFGHQPSPKHSSNESCNPAHPPNDDNFSIPSREAA